MLTIDNHLYEKSFQYNDADETSYLGARETELLKLSEICEYCRKNKESLLCNLDEFYETKVEPGVPICDWVFENKGTGDPDARSMLLYMLDSILEYKSAGDREIPISFGNYEGCISTVDEYKEKRRDFLAEIANVEDFTAFMGTCFQDTAFADGIISSMRKIPKFRECAKPIACNLALLNDHAVEIYERHNFNAAEAMKELSAKALECTGDPSHKEYLKFPFSYFEETEEYGRRQMIEKVECSPHMKLIRRDSNLRIYFFWFNDKIGDGKKVLIGHIGGHPY